MSAHESITRRLTVPELVATYQESVERIRRAFAEVADAENRLNAAFSLGEQADLRVRSRYSGHRLSFNDPEECLFELRKDVWWHIVDHIEIRRMMSTQRWKELEKQIDSGELPEITTESVYQVLAGFQANLDTMLREAVAESFDWLRPWRIEHKTNERNAKYELGPKVIRTGVVESAWGNARKFRPTHYAETRLTALENVFSSLDGRGSITKTHFADLSNAIKSSEDGTGETRYFRFKCFKNGNMHLEFKRLDLLERFNQIAGGKRLRAAE